MLFPDLFTFTNRAGETRLGGEMEAPLNNRIFAFFIVGLLSFTDSQEGLKVIFMAGLIAASFEIFYRAGRWLWTVRRAASAATDPDSVSFDHLAAKSDR